jgi:hypothetical protein
MEKEKLTRLKILRVMSYRLLHFLIKEKILSVFLTECLQNPYRVLLVDIIYCDILPSNKIYEFECYFTFAKSITLTESIWWRYAFKYREEYSWRV